MVMAPALLIATFAVAALLPLWFAIILTGYFLTTLAYTLDLKKRTIVDVLTLAILYTYRLLAGAAATGIELSTWLLAFALFLFISLALVKRYSELAALAAAGDMRAKARGYCVTDLPVIQSFGTSAIWRCRAGALQQPRHPPALQDALDPVGLVHPAALLDLAHLDARPSRQDASGSCDICTHRPDQLAGRFPLRRVDRLGDAGLELHRSVPMTATARSATTLCCRLEAAMRHDCPRQRRNLRRKSHTRTNPCRLDGVT
jgi:hypothetical protein